MVGFVTQSPPEPHHIPELQRNVQHQVLQSTENSASVRVDPQH